MILCYTRLIRLISVVPPRRGGPVIIANSRHGDAVSIANLRATAGSLNLTEFPNTCDVNYDILMIRLFCKLNKKFAA